jgi:hypothetical protein
MQIPPIRFPIILLLTVALSASLPAQPVRVAAPGDTSRGRVTGTIDGAVSDTNLVPLRGAFVSILGSSIRVGTGPNGRFRIVNVPVGRHVLIVKRSGYRPASSVVDVMLRDTLRVSYTLNEDSAAVLSPVVVNAAAPVDRLSGFEARRKLGVGEFMTSEEIAQRNTVYATELIRKFLSVNVSPSRTSSLIEYFPLSAREGGNPNVGACPMQVYLDQVPLPTPFNLDLLPSPRELAGIEVYAGSSTAPPQFAGPNRGCGVILVWTKAGY